MLSRIVFTTITKIALLALCMPLVAQRTSGQWVGDLYFVSRPGHMFMFAPPLELLIDEENVVRSAPGQPKKMRGLARHYNLPDAFPDDTNTKVMSQYWHNDALYSLLKTEDRNIKVEGISHHHLLHFVKWEENAWHFLGECKINQMLPQDVNILAIPCDNDRFIIISPYPLIEDDGQEKSIFYKASIRPSKSEIKLDSYIPLGMEEIRKQISEFEFVRIVFFSSFVIKTDNYAIIINQAGFYWIFSLEKASLVKSGMVFSWLTPEMVKKMEFSSIIFGANPEKYGTVLFLVLDDAALSNQADIPNRTLKILLDRGIISNQLYNELINTDFQNNDEAIKLLEAAVNDFFGKKRMTPNELKKYQQEMANELFDNLAENIGSITPFISWHRLYPETGRIEKLLAPPHGAYMVELRAEDAEWRPMPDGSVKFGFLDLKNNNSENEAPSENSDEEDDEGEDSQDNAIEDDCDLDEEADGTDG